MSLAGVSCEGSTQTSSFRQRLAETQCSKDGWSRSRKTSNSEDFQKKKLEAASKAGTPSHIAYEAARSQAYKCEPPLHWYNAFWAARATLKSPHTSGWKGQARVADELQQQHPEREVTRCEMFIKTHYKKDGTGTSHHVERLSRMCDDDLSIAHNDIDNDGVAKVFGTDTRGRVRGVGLGVSWSIVHNSNPYKRAYEEEHKSQVALEIEVDGLKSRMEDMEKIVASLSHSGSQMRSSTNHELEFLSSETAIHTSRDTSKLESNTHRDIQVDAFKEETVVAYGSLMGVSPDNSDYYRIVIDEIVDGDIELMD